VPAAAGKKIAKRTGIPFLFDMRGFWVDERVDSGLWKLNNPLYKLLYRIYKRKEQGYFNAASHIISLTHKGKQELVNRYQVSAEKVSVIPCCADMEHFDFQRVLPDLTASYKQKLGIPPSAKVLSYLGSLGGWYLSDEMLLFFRSLLKQYPDAVFLFITHDDPRVITASAEQLGIPANHIRVQPASRDEVPAWLSVSDWNIFFIKDAYSKKASSPTKQGEVMAMGIPVICNDIGDTGQIVAASGSGILVPQLDEKTFDAIVLQLKNGLTVSREQIRQKAIEIFDLQQGANTYKEVYQQLLK
jgi:glycosyltransferase involved in cell wall biosynthesis